MYLGHYGFAARRSRPWLGVLTSALLVVLSGCGGGGTAGTDPDPTSVRGVTITIDWPQPEARLVPNSTERIELTLAGNGSSLTAEPIFRGDVQNGQATRTFSGLLPGTYTLTVVAISSDGAVVAEGSSSVVIPEFGLARITVALAHTEEGYPMLVANGPSTGWVNQTLTFGGLATDHGGAITSYVWDFGDASPPVVDTTVATTSHVYDHAGTFVARLTATDNDGLTATAEIEVTIQDESLEFLRFEDLSDNTVPLDSVRGTVIIVAQVHSARPVGAVEFRIDDRLLAQVNTVTDLYTLAFDSTAETFGEHTLRLRAQTVAGVVLQSQTVFQVVNPRLQATLPDGSGGQLAFRADQGPPQTVSITNVGGGDLQWQAQTATSWINLTTTSVAITVQVDWSQLAAGAHSGSIVITSNGGELTIPVVAYVRELEITVN